MAGARRVAKFNFDLAILDLKSRNRLQLPPAELLPLMVGFEQSAAGKIRKIGGLFVHKSGELIELPSRRGQAHLNLGRIGEGLNWQAFYPPKLDFTKLTASLGPAWRNARAIHLVMSAPPGLELPARHPVWVTQVTRSKASRLLITSAQTGEILFVAPFKFRFFAVGIVAIKILGLIVAAAILKWLGPTGWGLAAGILGLLIIALLILLEMQKAMPPAPGAGPAAPGGGPVPAPGGVPTPSRYERALKRARELKKKLDERAKRHDNFNPFDPDIDELKKLIEDTNKMIDESDKDVGASEGEKSDLKKAIEDAETLLHK